MLRFKKFQQICSSMSWRIRVDTFPLHSLSTNTLTILHPTMKQLSKISESLKAYKAPLLSYKNTLMSQTAALHCHENPLPKILWYKIILHYFLTPHVWVTLLKTTESSCSRKSLGLFENILQELLVTYFYKFVSSVKTNKDSGLSAKACGLRGRLTCCLFLVFVIGYGLGDSKIYSYTSFLCDSATYANHCTVVCQKP